MKTFRHYGSVLFISNYLRNKINRRPDISMNNLVKMTTQQLFHTDSQKSKNPPPYEQELRGGNLWIFAAAGSIALALITGIKSKASVLEAASPHSGKPAESPENAERKKQLFSKEEVGKHHNMESGVWVTYKNGVYDVTEFVPKHPGAEKLLMAAGSSLETFWELYPIHKKPHVLNILEEYRIGDLTENDREETKTMEKSTDAFSSDPVRDEAFLVRSLRPFNGETDPRSLTISFYTPNELFFVRNHLPVPDIDAQNHVLEIDGMNISGKALTLADVKSLPKIEISSTIQCAGNRRSDMGSFKPVLGLEWTGGAIGNAKWGGAKLIDVLELAGFSIDKYDDPSKYHIQFEGLDCDPSGESYGASIPLSYLLDRNFGPVVAYEMNGETLPRDHGYPLRVILPGIVGARNVKWLGRISVSSEESQSPWQQRDYKVFSPSVSLNTVDYKSAPPIMDFPVNSYICSHKNGELIRRGHNIFRGYASVGGRRGIARVEISTDKGNTWETVDCLINENSNSRGSWVLWEKGIELENSEEIEIWVKAVDTSYNQQVESFAGIWNFRGLVSTAYHRVKLTVR